MRSLKFKFVPALATLLALSQGCVEMQILGNLRYDGSGMLDVTYVFAKELLMGKYAELENNELLPLDEEQVRTFVGNFPDVTLLDVNIVDAAEQRGGTGQKVNLRRVNYKIAFKDINDLKLDHLNFAYYPVEQKNYFQFRFKKRLPSAAEMVPGRPINPIASALSKDRNLSLAMQLPTKVLRTNGQQNGWTTVKWTIPINAIVGDRQPQIQAWAELNGDGSEQGALTKLWENLTREGWMEPGNLPTDLVDPALYGSPTT